MQTGKALANKTYLEDDNITITTLYIVINTVIVKIGNKEKVMKKHDKLALVPVELYRIFGKPRLYTDYSNLRKLHEAKEYGEMISMLKQYMGIVHDLRVGFVNSGGPKNSPAWMKAFAFESQIKNNEPIEVREIFFRKEFLATVPFETAIMAMVHELSHIVLYGIGHRYASHEQAVDMTAMWLGFSSVFEIGVSVSVVKKFKKKSIFDFFRHMYSDTYVEKSYYGYLKKSEIKTIARNIEKLA